jgi:hypothetical protein
VATKELQELRHQYKTAYTSYMLCVQALSDASQQGVWPSADILKQEEQALHELTFVRQALLDAMYAHSVKRTGGRQAHPPNQRRPDPAK